MLEKEELVCPICLTLFKSGSLTCSVCKTKFKKEELYFFLEFSKKLALALWVRPKREESNKREEELDVITYHQGGLGPLYNFILPALLSVIITKAWDGAEQKYIARQKRKARKYFESQVEFKKFNKTMSSYYKSKFEHAQLVLTDSKDDLKYAALLEKYRKRAEAIDSLNLI